MVGVQSYAGVTPRRTAGRDRASATGSRPFSSERVVETSHALPRSFTNLQRSWVTLFAQGHPMSHTTIRTLVTDDFAALATLENDVFAAMGETVLCPHYLRLCTEIFSDSCFLALDGERPVGYLLSFVRGH